MKNDCAQTWLTLHCQMISGVQRAILLLEQDTLASPAGSWPDQQTNTQDLLELGALAAREKKTVIRNHNPGSGSNSRAPASVILAYPLSHQGSLLGIFVVHVNGLDDNRLRTLQQTLDRSATWLQAPANDTESANIAARLATVLGITAKSLECATLQESASTVITYLAQVFQCDRVSFGQLRENKNIHVVAMSHSAQIDRRSEWVQNIEAAMEECLDEADSLTFPPLKPYGNLPAHKQLCARHSKGSVCTLLLNNNGLATGALTLERNNARAFDQQTIDILEAISAMIGPIFEMKRLQERPFLEKAADYILAGPGRHMGAKHFKARLATATLLGICLLLSVVSHTYRISADATLEGTEHRALVAAIDGFVDEAYLRAGEQVQKGDLIATLDTTNLRTKRRQLVSERDNLEKKHAQAIGSFKRAEATILEAQIGNANAQLSLIDEQIERTRITAPIDGIIVSGDLSHTLGAPVERGQVLFEIAPLDGYRMALQVNESDIAYVEPGQQGFLALAASPSERLSFVVEDIIGIAINEQGKNGFRVEARLESNTAQLRPGMQGVGKIETTERSLMWILGHALFDRISLWIWSKLP